MVHTDLLVNFLFVSTGKLFILFCFVLFNYNCRRLSTENSLKLDSSRLVPNLFRGSKEPPSPASSTAAAQPKLGYRSMVSVDDVPELFASLDSKFNFSLEEFYIESESN